MNFRKKDYNHTVISNHFDNHPYPDLQIISRILRPGSSKSIIDDNATAESVYIAKHYLDNFCTTVIVD